MSQDEELNNTATYYCSEDEGHAWVYIHEPRSIPADYKICNMCDVLDASEAIATLVREARIDELEKALYSVERCRRAMKTFLIKDYDSWENK